MGASPGRFFSLTRRKQRSSRRYVSSWRHSQQRSFSAAAHPRFQSRRWAVLAVVFGGLSFALWVLFASGWLAVRSVNVHGAASPQLYHRVAAEVDSAVGAPLARVNTARLTARLQSIAPLDQVRITRQWPHTLNVQVSQRVPAARTGESTDAFVDAQGVVFALVPPAQGGSAWAAAPDSAQLPVVRVRAESQHPFVQGQLPEDPAFQLEQVRAMRAQGVAVARAVKSVVGPVATVEFTDTQAVLALPDGRRIHWGETANTEAKVKVLSVLFEEGSPTHSARSFDVRDPDFPLVQYRLRGMRAVKER